MKIKMTEIEKLKAEISQKDEIIRQPKELILWSESNKKPVTVENLKKLLK